MVSLELDKVDDKVSLPDRKLYSVVYRSDSGVKGDKKLLASSIYLEGNFTRVRNDDRPHCEIMGAYRCKHEIA